MTADTVNEAVALPRRRTGKAGRAVPHSPFGSCAAFVRHYVSRRPALFGGLIAVAVAAAICSVGVQYGMKLLVDALSAASPAPDAARWALGFFIVLIAVESLLWRASGWLAARATIAAGVDIRLDLLDHLIGHPMRYFQNNLAGALGHRVTATAGAFGALVNRTVWDIAPPVINLVGAVLLFAWLDARMAATLALFALAITGGLILFGIRGRPLHRAYAEEAGRVGGELIDVITNIWAVKAFSARTRERARLRQAFGREANAQRKSWMYTERSRLLHDVLLWLMAGSMLIWSLLLWERGEVTTGDVVVVSALTFRILHGSRDLAMALIDMAQHLAYLGETLRIVGLPHEIRDLPEAAEAVPERGEIRFEAVHFGYGGRRPVLRGFQLHVPASQKLAIVGPSGAGKSTLVHLVQRMHDVEAGRILVDGRCVTTMRQDSLRAATAVVPQEVNLFHRSVRDNIRFARPQARDEEVEEAARAAFCHDFILDLPQGYDTLVGDRGTKLSGGQRQRIGIARAFLKDAPIIILDEATSGLDTASEIEVQAALDRLMHKRTVLAVAHRLSTIAGFDRVVVLMDGRVAEDGPPFELRRKGGLFARMWSLQAEGLAVEDALGARPDAGVTIGRP